MKWIRWIFVLALLLWGAFGVAWALDLRECVSVLSGTPVPGISVEEAVVGAVLYVASYLGALLVAPVLTIAVCLAEIPSVVESRGDGRPATVSERRRPATRGSSGTRAGSGRSAA